MSIFKVHESFLHAATAGEDLTGDLNKIVKFNEAGNLVLAGNGEVAFGTVYEEAANGYPATVQFGCIAKVKLGGTVVPGQRVMSNGSGLGIAATSALYAIGQAITGGVSGDVIPVALGGHRV